MKRLKYLLLASLVAFAACDEEDPIGPQTGAVRVTVTAGGAPLQGITVSLGAAGTAPVTTGADGIANFAEVPVGTYTVTVTGLSADIVCSSTTQPVTVAAGQTTAVQFACNLVRTASISGTVAFANGLPRPNAAITVTRTLPAPADPAVNLTTNAQGQYSLTGLRSGTYTVSLAATTGCTTAATTQTVTVAAGEARVVNFTCSVAPPPVVPATVAIQTITVTGAGGQQIPIPPNQLAGIINVNLGIEEGDQRVSRVRLRLGTETVCDQTFVSAAPEMELATFNVVCPVNTAEFNATTGVPRFLNANLNLVADIFTVAGGSTTAVHTATLNVRTLNIDATYARVTFARQALSTNTTRGGAANVGRRWFGGAMTVRALPVMYSGLAIQQVTLIVEACEPPTDLIDYFEEVATLGTAIEDCDDLTDEYDEERATLVDTSAPYEWVLPDDDDLGDDGVDDIEDDRVEIAILVLRTDGGQGPGTGGSTLCDDGLVPNFTAFLVSGCASGQPADAIRLDNFAPVVGQVDRMYRWAQQFAWPSRAEPDGEVAAFSGVSGWISELFTFAATRLEHFDDNPTSLNATRPRVADLGVGLPSSDYAIFRLGSATDMMQVVTTPASFSETFNDDVYYGNMTVQDVFGAAGATTNQRTRFYDRSFDGTGTSSSNLTAIQAAGSGARVGIDKGAPCYTSDALTCTNDLLNTTRLDTDREVIGVLGTLTIGGGGVMSGTLIQTSKMDAGGPEGGLPSGFPTGPNITRIRRMAPGVTSVRAGCWVGVLRSSNSVCDFAGGTGDLSGIADGFDFYTPQDNGNFYTQVHPVTGAVTNVNTDRASPAVTLDMAARAAIDPLLNTGYFVFERRLVDNAGKTSPTITRTFVWDRIAPVVGGISSPASVAAGASVAFTAGVADNDLELDRGEFFLRWDGGTLAVLQNTTTLGEFGPAAFTTTGTASASVQYFHSLRVAPATDFPTSGSLLRVFDFGRNVAEAAGGFVNISSTPVPTDPGDVTASSLYSNTAVLCWDTDGNGCPTNPTSATLTFQATVTAPVTYSPFFRADFLVGIDVNNDGAVDVDQFGNQLFAPIVAGSSVSNINNVSTYTRQVTVEQIVAASRRTTAGPITIRAIGYRTGQVTTSLGPPLVQVSVNGLAFTVPAGALACPAVAGTSAGCVITLAVD